MDLQGEAELTPRHGLAIHDPPPDDLCALFREYQYIPRSNINSDPRIIDFERGLTDAQKRKISVVGEVDRGRAEAVTKTFDQTQRDLGLEVPDTPDSSSDCLVYEHDDFPGSASPYLHSWTLTNLVPLRRASIIPWSSPIVNPNRSGLSATSC
jgi:hypothetical protein